MLKRDTKGRKTLSMLMGAGIVLLAGVGGAMAEGGFSEPSYSQENGSAAHKDGRGSTNSSSYGEVEYSGNGVEYNGTANAEAEAFVRNGVRSATVTVGSGASVGAEGGVIDQTSESKMISYSKNGGVIAKGRSETVTTVNVGGQKIVVVDEVAKAAARATPFGSSSATDVEQTVSSGGNGYAGGNVTTDKTIRK